MERISLVLPEDMNRGLFAVSKQHDISVNELIRRFINLGMLEIKNGPFFYNDENGHKIEIELFPLREGNKHQLW